MKVKSSKYLLFFLVVGLLACGGNQSSKTKVPAKQPVKKAKVDREARDMKLVSTTDVNQDDLVKIRKIEARQRVVRSRLIKNGKWKGEKNKRNRNNWEKGRDAELAKMLGVKKFKQYVNFKSNSKKN